MSDVVFSSNNNLRVPTRLGKEPIVSAVCEIRFASDLPVAQLLPGALYQHFAAQDPGVTIASLPSSELPPAIRAADINLRYAPVTAVKTSMGSIHISDFSIGVIAPMPYPGWTKFETFLASVFEVVWKLNIVRRMERHSIKAIDFLRGSFFSFPPHAGLNLRLEVSGVSLAELPTTIRSEVRFNNAIHVIEMQTMVKERKSSGEEENGALLSVDSVVTHDAASDSGIPTLPDLVSSFRTLHVSNKQVFFHCLSDAAIEALEPTYA